MNVGLPSDHPFCMWFFPPTVLLERALFWQCSEAARFHAEWPVLCLCMAELWKKHECYFLHLMIEMKKEAFSLFTSCGRLSRVLLESVLVTVFNSAPLSASQKCDFLQKGHSVSPISVPTGPAIGSSLPHTLLIARPWQWKRKVFRTLPSPCFSSSLTHYITSKSSFLLTLRSPVHSFNTH